MNNTQIKIHRSTSLQLAADLFSSFRSPQGRIFSQLMFCQLNGCIWSTDMRVSSAGFGTLMVSSAGQRRKKKQKNLL